MKSKLIILDEIDNACNFGQAILFLEMHPTDVLALVQSKAALLC
jgi:hypothetical protein